MGSLRVGDRVVVNSNYDDEQFIGWSGKITSYDGRFYGVALDEDSPNGEWHGGPGFLFFEDQLTPIYEDAGDRVVELAGNEGGQGIFEIVENWQLARRLGTLDPIFSEEGRPERALMAGVEHIVAGDYDRADLVRLGTWAIEALARMDEEAEVGV